MIPTRKCASCGGTCHWHDTDWVCNACGDEWQIEHSLEYACPGDVEVAAFHPAHEPRRWRAEISVVTRRDPFKSSTRVWACEHRHLTEATAVACAEKLENRPEAWRL